MTDPISLTTIDKKLAVLCERMTNSQKIQTSINQKMEKHIEQADKRLRDIEKCDEALINKTNDNKEEIDRLRNKSNVIDSLLAVLMVIAGALGLNNK